MKLSDYVISEIKKLGIGHIFYLPGGGAMHLNDSLGHTEGIIPVIMLHEQACAIAAEAYARITGNYGVCIVTSGPGATNTITGLAGAWLDGTPVIFISGQVKRADLVKEQGIRQFGIQEINIIDIVKPITKYAVQIENPEDIAFEFSKAVTLAKSGKPGPVWIDIPLDIQGAQIDETKMLSYQQEISFYECPDQDIEKTIQLFNQAKRPLCILGHGIRIGKAILEMRELIDYMQVPVMTTWNGIDLIEDDYPLFYGRPGAVGHRHANFIQQNADFVLTIGTRLNMLSTGYNFDSFLKNANHVMVEIDEHEMNKKSLHPVLKIHADARSFLLKMLARKKELHIEKREEWLSYCNKIRNKYPLFIPEQIPDGEGINTYTFVERLSKKMHSNDIFQFTSSGTAADISMYTLKIKKGQRAFLTKGLASMGFDLPACIGSCLASGKRRTICVTGDGGFMMNVQELATLKKLNLPIKIFILDNNGYGMIYSSQQGNFKRLTGCTPASGLFLPDVSAVAKAFGLVSEKIDDLKDLDSKIDFVLETNNPVICSVQVCIGQKITPRQTNYMRSDGQMASRALEDMSPLLDRAEFEENMLRSF